MITTLKAALALAAIAASISTTVAGGTIPTSEDTRPITPPIVAAGAAADGWAPMGDNLAQALTVVDATHTWSDCLVSFEADSTLVYCTADGYSVRLASLADLT